MEPSKNQLTSTILLDILETTWTGLIQNVVREKAYNTIL